MVLCTSLSPPPPPLSIRVDPIESTSSIKMIEGECSLYQNERAFTREKSVDQRSSSGGQGEDNVAGMLRTIGEFLDCMM